MQALLGRSTWAGARGEGGRPSDVAIGVEGFKEGVFAQPCGTSFQAWLVEGAAALDIHNSAVHLEMVMLKV